MLKTLLITLAFPDILYDSASEVIDDTFTYIVSDGESQQEVSVDIGIIDVRYPPLAVPDRIITQQGAPVTFNVLENDIVDEVTYGRIDSAQKLGQWTGAKNGSVSLISRSEGIFRYTPRADFCGIDQFSYESQEGQSTYKQDVGDVYITVRCDDTGEIPDPDADKQATGN